MRKLVNMLTTIAGIRNTVTEFKIKCFQKTIAKKVMFYHTKVINRSIAHSKFHTKNKVSLKFFYIGCYFNHLSDLKTYVAPTALRLRNAGVN